VDIGERQIRPLWLDEASTYWTTRESWLALLGQVGTDGSPPFYFVIVKAFTVVCGESEFALRLPSLVATLGLIPALYVLGCVLEELARVSLPQPLGTVAPLVH